MLSRSLQVSCRAGPNGCNSAIHAAPCDTIHFKSGYLNSESIMSENCADCGKPIFGNQGSYYRKEPHEDIGQAFHSGCGDPFGLKAKDAKIDVLRAALVDAFVSMKLAAALPGVNAEYDFRDSIRHAERALGDTKSAVEQKAPAKTGWTKDIGLGTDDAGD